jgi:hypothetical protein
LSLSAAPITVNQTLDLTKPAVFNGPTTWLWQNTPAFNGGFNVNIAEGDDFVFTIDFLGSQTLSVSNLSFVWAFSYTSGPSSSVDGTGTFEFLDANGAAILQSNVTATTENSVHFGQQFASSAFAGGLPASLTFYGVRYSGRLNDYSAPGLTVREYNNPAFYFNASGITIGQGAEVPEPSTWMLTLGGLALVVRTARRR